MKKILILHTKYRLLGGEDIAVSNEIELLKEYFDIKTIYFENNIKNYFLQFISFITGTNKTVEKEIINNIDSFKPDIVYIHNTWFKIPLSIFDIIKEKNIKLLVKLHNFRYFCTHSFFSSKHLKGQVMCNACGLRKKNLRFFNKYFDNSYIKSIFVNIHGRRFNIILKSNEMKILVLTRFHKNFLSSYGVGQHKIFHIPNYIKPDESNQRKKNKYIVYAGRISSEKGVEELINSFIKSNLIKYQLKILGTGPQLKKLKNKYASNRILFFGEVANEESLSVISRASAVVTTTKLYEGQPTLLCEASSLGVASIFPKTGGIDEFFPKNYSLAFKQFDYVDLTNKLNLIDDEETINKIGIENKTFINEYLDKKNLVKKFDKITND
jgi:glycosyltransferase involved in cell wall biosynthesis